jgi:hypothetical protein
VSTNINKKEKETKMVKYLLGAMMLVSAYSLNAQSMCMPADEALYNLKKDYGEEPSIIGKIDSTNEVILVMANEKTGSWSLLVLDETGSYACPIASGEKYKIIQPSGVKL